MPIFAGKEISVDDESPPVSCFDGQRKQQSRTLPLQNSPAAARGQRFALTSATDCHQFLNFQKPHKALLARLQRLSRSLSRKRKGSANRKKAKAKLAKLHARIAAIRSDALHKLTTDLTRRFHTVCIENLNVRGMMRNRHLSRAITDMGFFEFRRQLEYKAAMRGGQVVVADRFYPSSKTCSDCGHKLDTLPLAVRSWTCPCCGTRHDRDVNAAINLKNLAVSSTVSACGEESSAHALRACATGLCEAGSKQQIRS